MTQDIWQWLAEIKALQQKLAEVQQERDQAYGSAANWRSLYETEARQRRAETETAQAKLAELQAELIAQQPPTPDFSNYHALLRQRVGQWQTVEQLQSQLLEVWQDRDRLAQLLQAEQQAHEQTRQDLTTALGDTMELLSKAKSEMRVVRVDFTSPVTSLESHPTSKPTDPSPERPKLHLVQFPS